MKPFEKSKVQKVIHQIQNGDFDENNVDSLFTILRPYSRDSHIFREVADLIAHNDERNQGIANSLLEGFYLTFKYFLEYVSPNLALDISKPFPLYIRDLMVYQVSKCNESELLSKHKVTKQKLETQIRNLFKEDKKNKTACLRGKINSQTHEAIKFIMDMIHSIPAFDQEELINQIVAVLCKNSFEFDEFQFRSQGSKITLCILLLFHKTPFDFKGYKSGYSKIFCEQPCIPHDEVNEEAFGSLQVLGNIILEKDGKDITFCFPLVNTNLKAEDWCDETLFSMRLSQNNPSLLEKCVDFDSDLGLNNDFKLCKTSS